MTQEEMDAIRNVVADALTYDDGNRQPACAADPVDSDTVMVELSDGRTFALVVQPA